jgi:hypothetical protein
VNGKPHDPGEGAPDQRRRHAVRNLRGDRFLLENRHIEGLESHDPSILQINTRDVLTRLQRGDAASESAVPERVAAIIKERRLFQEHGT